MDQWNPQDIELIEAAQRIIKDRYKRGNTM